MISKSPQYLTHDALRQELWQTRSAITALRHPVTCGEEWVQGTDRHRPGKYRHYSPSLPNQQTMKEYKGVEVKFYALQSNPLFKWSAFVLRVRETPKSNRRLTYATRFPWFLQSLQANSGSVLTEATNASFHTLRCHIKSSITDLDGGEEVSFRSLHPGTHGWAPEWERASLTEFEPRSSSL
jgi:hypothetical protein